MNTKTEVANGYPRWDGLNYLFIPNDVRGHIEPSDGIWNAFTESIGKLGSFPLEEEARAAVERYA